MTSTQGVNRSKVFAVLVAAAATLAAHPGAAQTTSSPWTAWFGCWEPVAPTVEMEAPAPAPQPGLLCVVPGNGAAEAEFVTIAEGSEERVRLSADGQRVALERDGCSGWESVEASVDGKRIYRFSEVDCGGQVPRRTSSILAFVNPGEWVDVEGVSVADFTDIRVARYRRTSVAAEVAPVLEGLALQIDAARTAASARIDLNDIIDASRQVEAAVVEGWLIERNQGFDLNPDRLRALARADVPGRVIDLMVALSYPDVFAIDRRAREGEFIRDESVTLASALGQPIPPTINRWRDLTPYYTSYHPYFGWGYEPFYTYSRLPQYSSWYFGPPVIILREPVSDGDAERPQPRSVPRLVNGRGFSRGGNPSASNSGASSSGPTQSVSPSPSAGSSSQGAASAPVRTAKPRGE